MTWRTQHGDRVLEGAEAQLISKAVRDLVSLLFDAELIEEDEMEPLGVKAFDTLTFNSKLTMLADVGRALLCETDTCPELTAVSEGTVAAIYHHIADSVIFEIDCRDELPDRTAWRRLVLNAYVESGDLNELPEPDSNLASDWMILIECLTDRVLWDRDFNDGDLFLDAPPAGSVPPIDDILKSREGYFTAIAPDPRDSEMPVVLARLKDLYRG